MRRRRPPRSRTRRPRSPTRRRTRSWAGSASVARRNRASRPGKSRGSSRADMAQSELYRRGYDELKAGRYDEAKRLFAEDEAKAGTAASTRALLRDAEKRLAAGDLNGAAPLYDQLLDRNPSLPEVYFGLARISIATGKLDAAKVHATAATKLAPDAGLS